MSACVAVSHGSCSEGGKTLIGLWLPVDMPPQSLISIPIAVQVDLHGLHVEEGLARLEHQLLCLGGLAADHPEGLTLRVIVGAHLAVLRGELCALLPAQWAAVSCCGIAAVVCPVQTRRAPLVLEHRAPGLDIAVRSRDLVVIGSRFWKPCAGSACLGQSPSLSSIGGIDKMTT